MAQALVQLDRQNPDPGQELRFSETVVLTFGGLDRKNVHAVRSGTDQADLVSLRQNSKLICVPRCPLWHYCHHSLVHLDPNRNFSGFNCPPYARYSLASGAQSDTANEQNSILATIPSPPDVAPAPVRLQVPISVDEPASVQFSFASTVAAESSPSRSSNSSCAPVEQRLNQRLDVEYVFAKPQNSDQDVVHHEVPPSQSRFNGVRDERRKRQREFSHRTKTGCLTCRRRKKKCDEAKPECRPEDHPP